jgi:hypothetical protein
MDQADYLGWGETVYHDHDHRYGHTDSAYLWRPYAQVGIVMHKKEHRWKELREMVQCESTWRNYNGNSRFIDCQTTAAANACFLPKNLSDCGF